MNEHPYMPLFFGDVLKQTVFWQGEERALLLLLMAVQWSTGTLPLDLQKLSNAVQYPLEVFTRLWHTHVHEQFTETEDGYINAELEQHREHLEHLSAVRAAAGRASGKARRAKARASRREQTREHVFKQTEQQDAQTDEPTKPRGFVQTPSHPNPEPLSSDSGSSADLTSPPVQASLPDADPPPAAAAPKGAPRRKRMPADFDTEKWREWARINAPLADFDAEVAMIRDHEFRDAHSDWDAVLRNWLRKAHRDNRNARRPPPGPERITRFEAHKRRLFREEQG